MECLCVVFSDFHTSDARDGYGPPLPCIQSNGEVELADTSIGHCGSNLMDDPEQDVEAVRPFVPVSARLVASSNLDWIRLLPRPNQMLRLLHPPRGKPFSLEP